MINKSKFNGIKLELQLRAQTPMLHFQANTPGATIRATEVKPKLDRFILKKLEKSTGKSKEELKKDPEYQEIFQKADSTKAGNENYALRYKMQISTAAPIECYKAGGRNRNEYSIFYGNMGDGPQKKAVFSDPKVTIQCFSPKLRSLIETYLVEFFLVTNFGTMQGKGFGSFAPADIVSGGMIKDADIEEIAGYLKEEAETSVCYYMSFDKITLRDQTGEGRNNYCNKMFDEIKVFYGIMKSGINFRGYAKSYIFKYMLDEKNGDKYGNEKAWMKHKGLAPKVATSDIGRQKLKTEKVPLNPRYVRAMLGVGSKMIYKERGQDDVVIKMENTEFERLASPIFFKIVGNIVFIVAKKIPDEIYDKTFTFKKYIEKRNGNNKKELEFCNMEEALNTPKKEEFNLQEMLDKYVKYYNSDQRVKDLEWTKVYKKVVKLS